MQQDEGFEAWVPLQKFTNFAGSKGKSELQPKTVEVQLTIPIAKEGSTILSCSKNPVRKSDRPVETRLLSAPC